MQADYARVKKSSLIEDLQCLSIEESKSFYGHFFENFSKKFSSLFSDDTVKPLMFEV